MSFFRHKIIITVFIINIVIILTMMWVSNKREQNKIEIHQLEADLFKIIKNSEAILLFVSSLENNSKAYVITGNQKYLDRFNKTVFGVRKALESLAVFFKNNGDQLEKINRLEKLVKEVIYYNEVAKYNGIGAWRDIVSFEKDIHTIRQIDEIIFQIQQKGNNYFELENVKRKDLQRDLSNIYLAQLIGVMILSFGLFFIIINDLKRSKEALSFLEKQRQLLQSIFDVPTNPIFIKQLNGEYILVNKQFESLFPNKDKKVKGKTDHQLFSKEIADDLRSHDMEVISAGKEIEFEEKYSQSPDSHTYKVVRFPVLDSNGKTYSIAGIATDITESEVTNRIIRESEDEMKTLLHSAPDAVVVINEESNIIHWNTWAENLFGWSAEEIIGKPIYKILMPSHYRQLHLKSMKRFLETGEGNVLNRTIEATALKKNNNHIDIEITISYIKTQSRNMFIAFIKDLTKRKMLERENKRSAIFLNSIIDNIPNMIFVKDAKELRFLLLNKGGEELLGFFSTDLIGKNDYDFFPKEQADFFTNKDKEVLSKKVILDIPEEEIDTKKGKYLLHTKKIPILDEKGEPVFLLGISENITEKKKLQDEHDKAENLLHENQKRMMLILDSISEGIIVVDDQQKVLLANLEAEESWGIEEGTGRIFNWADHYELFFPDGRTTFPAQEFPLEKALKGESTDEVEMVLYDPAVKRVRVVKVTGRPIRDENNKIVAAVATIRDITKYKKMEEALKKSEIKSRNLIGFGRNVQ